MTTEQKNKAKRLLEAEMPHDPSLLYEEMLQRNTEYFSQVETMLASMGGVLDSLKEIANVPVILKNAIKDHLEPLSSIPQMIQLAMDKRDGDIADSIKTLKPKELDLAPFTNALTSLGDAVKKGNESSTNKIVDSFGAGVKQIVSAHEQKTEELKTSFKETTQPLIDQNKEKLAIMKQKPTKGEQTIVSNGSAISSVNIRGYGIVKTGRTTSTTVGTGVKLSATSVPCRRIDITALKGNANPIYIGDVNVLATAGSELGNILFPTNTVTLSISDASQVYFDVLTSGDGISYTIYN